MSWHCAQAAGHGRLERNPTRILGVRSRCDGHLHARYERLEATLRILKQNPQMPVLILTMHESEQLVRDVLSRRAGRRELLDRTLFWTTSDLETKLTDFQHYYNAHRTDAGLAGRLPEQNAHLAATAPPDNYQLKRPAPSLHERVLRLWPRICDGTTPLLIWRLPGPCTSVFRR